MKVFFKALSSLTDHLDATQLILNNNPLIPWHVCSLLPLVGWTGQLTRLRIDQAFSSYNSFILLT